MNSVLLPYQCDPPGTSRVNKPERHSAPFPHSRLPGSSSSSVEYKVDAKAAADLTKSPKNSTGEKEDDRLGRERAVRHIPYGTFVDTETGWNLQSKGHCDVDHAALFEY